MSSEDEILERPEALAVERRAKLFRGLGDLSRLAILETLRPGPLPVGAIVAATGLSQPNASNHLRCLSECGLVASEQRGRFVYYRLTDTRIGALLQLAGDFLETVHGIDACESYVQPNDRGA